jgi:hypothetical protein
MNVIHQYLVESVYKTVRYWTANEPSDTETLTNRPILNR